MRILTKLKSSLNSRIIFSIVLFLVCMSLDFSVTNFYIQGNINLEGNLLNIYSFFILFLFIKTNVILISIT